MRIYFFLTIITKYLEQLCASLTSFQFVNEQIKSVFELLSKNYNEVCTLIETQHLNFNCS
jgi:hypothetical protein